LRGVVGRRGRSGRTTASRRCASAWGKARRRSSNGSGEDGAESESLPDRGVALEEGFEGFQGPSPEVVPIARDGLRRSVKKTDKRRGSLRGQLIRDARLDRPAFPRNRPGVREPTGAVDRGDGAFDPTLRGRPLIPSALLRLDLDILSPPHAELFRIHKGLEDDGNGC